MYANVFWDPRILASMPLFWPQAYLQYTLCTPNHVFYLVRQENERFQEMFGAPPLAPGLTFQLWGQKVQFCPALSWVLPTTACLWRGWTNHSFQPPRTATLGCTRCKVHGRYQEGGCMHTLYFTVEFPCRSAEDSLEGWFCSLKIANTMQITN